jgi:hypothetical protein
MKRLGEIRQRIALTDHTELDNAIACLDGDPEEQNILRSACVQRYAVGIKQEKSAESDVPSSFSTGYSTYVRGETAAAIDAGLFETLPMRGYQRVVRTLANLFTARGQRYEYTGLTDDRIEALMTARTEGRYYDELCRADEIACAIGSSAILASWTENAPQWTTVSPQRIKMYFTDRVESNTGDEIIVDTTKIDHAFAIRIQTSTVNSINCVVSYRFVYVAGESEKYPDGRYCIYDGNEDSDPPEIGSNLVYEYVVNGTAANPYTLIARTDENAVEYPLAFLYGSSSSVTNDILRSNMIGLYRVSQELDIGTSRLFGATLESGVGLRVVKDPSNQGLPRCVSGTVSLKRDQDLTWTTIGAANADSALQVVERLKASIAQSYNVPEHVVSGGLTNPESGVAIALKYKPMIEERNRRIEINKHNVDRLWRIERTLYNTHSQEQIPWDSKQTWIPGETDLPTDETAKLDTLKKKYDDGAIDYVTYVREANGLETDKQAEEYITKMNERAGQFAPPSRTGSAPVDKASGFLAKLSNRPPANVTPLPAQPKVLAK